MPHRCDAASLRGCAEEDDPEVSVFDVLDVLLYCTPRRFPDRALIVVYRAEMNFTIHINLNLISIADRKARLLSWAEKAGHDMSNLLHAQVLEAFLTRGTFLPQNLRVHLYSQLEHYDP